MPTIIRTKGPQKRPVRVPRRVANALLRHGTFQPANPEVISRTKSQVSAAHAASLAKGPAAKREAKEKEEADLTGLTKTQLADYLRQGGEKVDQRNNKNELLRQALRYQRRDMRAEG